MNNPGKISLPQVERALQDLGGEANWAEILGQVTKIRNGDYSYYGDYHIYEETANQVIQNHCEGYKKYKGPTRFEKIGHRRRYRLLGMATPVAIDIEEPSQPDRVKQETYRILRDTALARQVKETKQYRCQLCGQALKLKDESPYAEAHHIRPLGAPHNGPDIRENILCVCPNDHVLLDYGAIILDGEQLKGIGREYIDYHNEYIFGRR